jgi:hypothetical protein
MSAQSTVEVPTIDGIASSTRCIVIFAKFAFSNGAWVNSTFIRIGTFTEEIWRLSEIIYILALIAI